MTTIESCPVCESKKFRPFISCIDFTVSRETFHIVQCESCSFTLTNPQPPQTDIGRYYQSDEYISHTNKASSLIDRIYLYARNYTLKWKLGLIDHATESDPAKTQKRLLDFGCGTGAFIQYCRQNDWTVSGVEPSSQARQLAQRDNPNVFESLNQCTENTYDIITLWHVLEHVPNLDITLQQLKEKLSVNGTMFIAVPNYKSWDGNHYNSYWAGYDVPRHLWHFSQSTMTLLLQKNNLNLVATIPMKLDAFYICLLSEKYKTGKMSIASMAVAFMKGLKSNWTAKKNNEYSSLIYVIRK
jgi:2-polyprenyl-3-methyl-5-hydroxy-6-metoxy-1,4-benzoquinol methylase